MGFGWGAMVGGAWGGEGGAGWGVGGGSVVSVFQLRLFRGGRKRNQALALLGGLVGWGAGTFFSGFLAKPTSSVSGTAMAPRAILFWLAKGSRRGNHPFWGPRF